LLQDGLMAAWVVAKVKDGHGGASTTYV